MSLIGFHRVLILAAVLFCGGFALWSGLAWWEGGGAAALLAATGFGLAGVGLLVYLRHLDRFLGREREP